jgi:hypothetical protein
MLAFDATVAGRSTPAKFTSLAPSLLSASQPIPNKVGFALLP